MSDQIDQKEAFAAEMREASGNVPAVEIEKPEAKADATLVKETEPVAKGDEPAIFDVNSLPPAAKAQWETTQKRLAEIEDRNKHLDQQNRSFRSKTPHLEAKAARLENELRAIRERPLSPRAREEKPGAAQAPGKPVSALQSLPGWPKLRQIFADDAAPIEEAFTALESHNQKLAERLEQSDARMAKMEELLEKDVRPRFQDVDDLRAEREEIHRQTVNQGVLTARDSITKNYADWQSHIEHKYDPDTNEITETKVSEAMRDWLPTKPKFIEDALYDGGPKEVKLALDLFYREALNVGASPVNVQKAEDTLKTRQDNLSRRAVHTSNGAAPQAEGKLSAADQYRRDMQAIFN